MEPGPFLRRALLLLAMTGCAETYVETPVEDARPVGDAARADTAQTDARPQSAGDAAAADSTPSMPDAFVPVADARCGLVGSGDELAAGERMTSCNGSYFLLMQNDDNLVLYEESGASDLPLWASDTVDSGAVRAIMQGDGNLVLYRACASCTAADAVWASDTADNPGAHLEVRNNGRLAIVSPGGVPLWQAP